MIRLVQVDGVLIVAQRIVASSIGCFSMACLLSG